MERLTQVTWRSRPLFNLDVTRADIEARFGPATHRDLNESGVGDFDGWILRFPCGLELALWWFTERTVPFNLEIHANDLDRRHLLFHLDFPHAEPSLWQPDTSFLAPLDWQVVRLDDNGNLFEAARTSSECEARALVTRFESHGHKQTYWHRHEPR